MNGVLVVDKPAGPTSHDVVGRVRRALRTRRIGHTGTLDPLATGVLPLVVGRATRLAQFLSADEKEYLADVQFGVATTTYDALGARVGDGNAAGAGGLPVDLAGLETALTAFRGTYLQMPPAFSAKKVAGERAYDLARAGRTPELAPVPVTVTALEIVSRGGATARLRVACSSGFYVRTLAHELGQRLGCGAHLAALRRVRAGSFEIADAVPLDVVEAEGATPARLIALERLLPAFSSVMLTAQGLRRALHGNVVSPSDYRSDGAPMGSRVRLFDEAGALVALAEQGPGGALHPAIVLV
jgi:tRNA pseudouridine55 synthase